MGLFGSIKKDVTNAAKDSATFDWSNAFGHVGNALGTFGTLVGPAVGAYLSYKQQDSLLQKQMDFQERMSNTAHQREVADLIAAGINPLYTATGGNGATTPMGATGSQTDFANAFGSGIGMATSRSLQKAMQTAQFEQMALDNANKREQKINLNREGRLLEKQIDNYDREVNARIGLMSAQGQAALASGGASSATASYYQGAKIGQELRNYEERLRKEFGDNSPALRNFQYFLDYTGLGSFVSGFGAGAGAGIGAGVGRGISAPRIPHNPIGFRVN